MAKKRTLDVNTTDSFVNFLAKLGANTQNIQSYSQYSLAPFVSRLRTLLEAAYRSSWLVGQVVDTVAEDMTREGVSINSELSPDDVKLIQSTFTDLNIWHELSNTIKWARLYGGAIAVILTEGADYSKPLNMNAIGKGRFKGLVVFDRWMIDPSLGELVTELGSDMGKPKYYRVIAGMPTLGGEKIHYSRIIRFDGIELPYFQKLTENLWGLSVVERLYDRLIAFDSATQGASQLLHKAHLRTIRVKGFREALALGGATESAVVKQFDYIRMLQTLEGLTVLDGDDEFNVHSYSFSGISDVLMQFGEQISGATGIPLVRLFGQSPAGLSSTGESDLRNYYDHINKLQEFQMRAPLVKLFNVISRSLFGKALPREFEFEFNPLWQLSDTEKSQIASTDANTISTVYGAGLISKKTAMKELANQSRITGRFSKITEEDIENAQEEIVSEGGESFPESPPGGPEDDSPLPLPLNEKSLEELQQDLENLGAGEGDEFDSLKRALEEIDVNREIVDKPSATDGTVRQFFKDSVGKVLKPLIGLAILYKWLKSDKKQISTEERARRLLGQSPFSPGQDSVAPPTKKELLVSIQKELKNIRSTFDEHLRAPKGGVTIKGKAFKGGEFIPSEGGYAEEYKKMQEKEEESAGGEKPAEENKTEKKQVINYPEPKRTKLEANFTSTKRSPPVKVVNKKGEEIEKPGVLTMVDGSPLPEHVANIPIPPAWQHVRINPDPNGEALIAGTDQNGKRQIKYSEAHDKRVAIVKFNKTKKLNDNINEVVKNIEKHYGGEKNEEALCLRFIEQTGARADTGRNVGSVKTYGASSLENRHIKIDEDGSVTIEFVGKHGKPNSYKVVEPVLVKMFKERAERPDKEQKVFDTTYGKLKAFSAEVAGVTPKVFRTRVGTNIAKDAVNKLSPPPPKTEKEFLKYVLAVAEKTSQQLCNTRKVCLDKYIDPAIFEGWKRVVQTEARR